MTEGFSAFPEGKGDRRLRRWMRDNQEPGEQLPLCKGRWIGHIVAETEGMFFDFGRPHRAAPTTFLLNIPAIYKKIPVILNAVKNPYFLRIATDIRPRNDKCRERS